MTSLKAASDAASKAISDAAKAEGGPTKGSASAKMQSDLSRALNAEKSPSSNIDGSSNKSAAGEVISNVAKAEGGTTKGSTSAKMQSELTKAQNASAGVGSGSGAGAVDSATQSQMDKEANLAEAQDLVVPKMEHEPEHVTKEDASLLRSREVRAHGATEKGGVAATAQHQAAENEKQGTI